ncbi:hypothetical protein Pcinc_043470 [Petrolisthes cinctipes]|uniref:Gamma-butyrobetaine hydroxylase-like N-terminal domain-containing protein n=1 Tax=Petrolisthes cinctipes TaxID=88211 RepID=A0AAE1EHV1_PETCI|nr:hypothetical protein Pcinc_043470 [Petrolisthes cinctipes]
MKCGRVGGECQVVEGGGKEQTHPHPHPHPPSSSITKAHRHPQHPLLQVEWDDGGSDMYPYVWLRDNCPCSDCFHPVAMARRRILDECNLADSPASLQVCVIPLRC